MAGTKGIRWPEELDGIVEKAALEDNRSFSAEVLYLVGLGLKEREIIKTLVSSRYDKRMAEARKDVSR